MKGHNGVSLLKLPQPIPRHPTSLWPCPPSLAPSASAPCSGLWSPICNYNYGCKLTIQKFGIKGVPLLSHIRSLTFPISFPYDFMHLIWENLIRNLILHWTGEFKSLNSGNEDYTISKAIWAVIGTDMNILGSTIPSSYGSHCPDIAAHWSYYSAEMYSFWTQYIGPVLLKQQLDAKYYNHFVHLVWLLMVCLQFEITNDETEEVHQSFIDWVKDYEM